MTTVDDWLARRSEDDCQRPNDRRSPFQRDRARVLHSAAFRRLQAKTQILGVGQNDFYRTRLTHSLEVSQIGSSLQAQLRYKYPEHEAVLSLDDSLMESLCLAHDIGHPPFGHGGEVALNYKMAQFGGFEGNGQTLRILAVLEPYTENYGMNLTRRTLLGSLKYPALQSQVCAQARHPWQDKVPIVAGSWKPAKGLFDDDENILDWILAPLSSADQRLFTSVIAAQIPTEHGKTQFKSLDASIMELADDIAYGVHDLEDAIVVGNVSKDLWYDTAVADFISIGHDDIRPLISQISANLFSHHHLRKDAIGQLVNLLITSITLSQHNADFNEPLLKYNAQLPQPAAAILNVLKQFVYQHVIQQPKIQQVGFKGQKIIMELFDAFASDPLRLLPSNTQQRYIKAQQRQQNPQRIICDYISGMTDEYALRMYRRMFMV